MQPTLAWILATLSAVLFLAAALVWRLGGASARRQKLPSEWALSPRPVFSTDERRAYKQLREALPHHVLLSKLPLVRFCQPIDPQEVRYWYELLGSVHVTFAICSANGRVLAAIDLDHDRSSSRRSAQIKQAVLAACRVRYLRCPPDHLPSIPELQLLVPQAASAARGPQAAPAPWRANEPGLPGRRRESAALWQDSDYLKDSFFGMDRAMEPAPSGFGSARPAGRDAGEAPDDIGGVVIETPAAAMAARVRPASPVDTAFDSSQIPTLREPVAGEGSLQPPSSPLRH